RSQAGEHAAPRGRSDGGRFRDRPRGQRGGGPADHPDGIRRGDAGVHESGAGSGRADARCPERRVQPRLRAVRDARRRAALHRADRPGPDRKGDGRSRAGGAPAAADGATGRRPGAAQGPGEGPGRPLRLDGGVHGRPHRAGAAPLADAETDRHLWAETYDRQLTDLFGIQTDVALHIAQALKAELSVDEQTRIRKEPTNDLRAYQLYLLGRHWLVRYTPVALQRAIEHFQGAIAKDPAYALAYASVAMAYAELAESGAMAPDTAAREAKEAAAHAVRIDPQLGEAHCTVAYLKTIWDFDWAGAEAEFKRALELSP